MRQAISRHYGVGGPTKIGQKFLQDTAGYAVQSMYLGLLEQGRRSMKRKGGSFSPLALIPRLLSEKGNEDMTADQERDFAVYMGGLFDAAAGSTMMSFQTLILPRMTSQDQDVLGYQVPKGTLVVLNKWSIAHDPEFYDKPEDYNPERYYNDPVGAKPGISEPGRKGVYTFGAGRRGCLGKDYFFQNVRIAMAQILWAYDIVPDGPLEAGVEKGFTSATVMMPLPFKVKFVPRKSESILLDERLKADQATIKLLGQGA